MGECKNMATPAPVTTNPVIQHSREYRIRRFLNWFPLGLTYATFYMGRYNFNVVKGDMGKMFDLTKTEMGIIATAGFWTYALSVMFNGPLADRIGGKKAILIGAVGAATMNLVIGLLFLSGWHTKVLVGMSMLYSANCYFQSFGALSVVKVNAPWFHVRERGVFGGIFGIMISTGYLLAITVGGLILARFPWYMIFIIPAFAIMTMFIIDLFVVRDSPKSAGFENFNTGDASAGDETPIDFSYLVKKVFSNPIIITLACAEFCTGFVRQGLLLYFTEFLHEVHNVAPGSMLYGAAGLGVTVGGVCGGLLCGYLSDHFFQSRRPPVAFIFYIGQVVSLLALGLVGHPVVATLLVGFSCSWIFGVHGMLSGTASADFGGKKAAATVTGLLDGVQYIASGLTGFGLGYIIQHYGWGKWTISIIPFSIIGGLLMLRIWNAKPQPKGAGGH
jgi:MFS transporter, OPA family, glycerol-3-phosphate transporter